MELRLDFIYSLITFPSTFHPACLLSIVCSILILCIVKANEINVAKELSEDLSIPFETSSSLPSNSKDELMSQELVSVEDTREELFDIAALKRKLAQTEIAMTHIIARMSEIGPKPQVS